ncbi:thioredoxin family protein [Bacillus sp. SCS-153A]|uniref:thioredoxin family protein n=1 Tax=Rossellomorea sedimentorum TaxID=3115294 RepID=UPI0039063A29
MKNHLPVEQIQREIHEKKYTALYLYTPMCGTCMVAGRMVDVTEKMFPHIHFIRADLNYIPSMADQYSVESVPCMLLFHEGVLQNKIYAFQSVPYLHEQFNHLTNADSV